VCLPRLATAAFGNSSAYLLLPDLDLHALRELWWLRRWGLLHPFFRSSLPKAERRRIAEGLGVTEEDVRKGLLSYALSKEPEPDVIDVGLEEIRAEFHGRKARVKFVCGHV